MLFLIYNLPSSAISSQLHGLLYNQGQILESWKKNRQAIPKENNGLSWSFCLLNCKRIIGTSHGINIGWVTVMVPHTSWCLIKVVTDFSLAGKWHSSGIFLAESSPRELNKGVSTYVALYLASFFPLLICISVYFIGTACFCYCKWSLLILWA